MFSLDASPPTFLYFVGGEVGFEVKCAKAGERVHLFLKSMRVLLPLKRCVRPSGWSPVNMAAE